jgi:hypothetical protein
LGVDLWKRSWRTFSGTKGGRFRLPSIIRALSIKKRGVILRDILDAQADRRSEGRENEMAGLGQMAPVSQRFFWDKLENRLPSAAEDR